MSEEGQVDTATVEKEARQFGWVALDEFRGGEDKWVDAETFVKRGKEITPILRENNKRLQKDLDAAKSEIEEIRQTAKEFRQYQKDQLKVKIEQFDNELARLKAAKAQAINDSDGTTVAQIEEAIDSIKESKAAIKVESEKPLPEDKKPASNKPDPVLQAWLDQNDWFGSDKRMTRICNSIGEDLREDYPDLVGKPFLDKLSEEIEKEFPDRFTKRKPTSPVEGGSNKPAPRRGSNEHSYDKLPADAKAACDRYVKQKLMTKEEYVNEYQWD